ncbi:70 kDa neurofilament protein-like [Babylonia areolata]|uniref:70 kDa neurofilament protein-like n=1 Tax=Babylonia areolata TaxID=304850 RepID=UPI003FD5A483
MSQTIRTSSSGFSSIPVNTAVTEKRTVITTSSSQNEDLGLGDFQYRSSIQPRNTSIQRTSTSSMGPLSPGGMAGSRITRTMEISSGYTSPAYVNIANSGVTGFKNTREREKQDMRDLNERFANYIEKVRFLEAQNRKLASELDDLRSKWGKETNAVKTMYETELEEARKVIEETNKDRSRLQVRVGQLEEQMDDSQRQLDDAKKWRSQDRETINKLNQQISDLEAEIRMLRRTNDSLDTERQRDKQAINRLNEELEKLRLDLSNETILRLDAENRAQTLAEELEFLKSVHEQELKELAALAYRDTTAENREFWKNELSQAIRDIQNEYDSKMDTIRGEMETFYNLKVQEFRTGATKQNMEVTHAREETKKVQKMHNDCKIRMADLEARNAQLEKQYQDLLREMEQKEQDHTLEINQLKDEMNKLRAEMESMLVELQTLMDAKLSLELEIAAYRKLLETEESRVGLRSVVEQTLGVRSSGSARLAEMINVSQSEYEGGDSSLQMKMMRGEVSAKTTYQRTANGPVAIAETHPEGKFIVLENNPSSGVRKDVSLMNWSLQRVVDNKRTINYKFPTTAVVKLGKTLRIWAGGFSSERSAGDLVFGEQDSWGTGSQITTTLLNDKNEEKASHIQKTLYS